MAMGARGRLVVLLSLCVAAGGAFVLWQRGLLGPDLVNRLMPSPPPPPEPERRPTRLSAVRYPEPAFDSIVVERPGADPWGYPRRYVDRVRVLSLFQAKHWPQLTREIERVQASFRDDYRNEYLVDEAAGAFEALDTKALPLLDEWQQQAPQSFAPLLARASLWRHEGGVRRGGKLARETTREQLAGMEDADARARNDLARALEIDPGLVEAHRLLVTIAKQGTDRAAGDAFVAQALAHCPDCFLVRVSHMIDLTPRWGGSYEEMTRFAVRAVKASKNPRLKLLTGFADWDRCNMASLQGREAEALKLCNRALTTGESFLFLGERARVRAAMGDHAGAMADYDKALDLDPQDIELLDGRARSLDALDQWLRMAPDVGLLRLLAPREDGAEELATYVIEKGMYEASELGHKGRYADAAKLYDVVMVVDPGYQPARLARAAAATLPDLVRANAADPGNLDLCTKLDRQAGIFGRDDIAVGLWTRYIEHQPDSARGYFERGGSYYHGKHMDEAKRDIDKACSLGLPQACGMAKQLWP